jgi:site-specific DNA-methyltransferase (adenine-specific)/site-specific DNA-methyltransferase (cytosine-N4-specific)
MVEVFREVRRVLRDDGTLWLNIGDSYNGSGGCGGDYRPGGNKEGQPVYPGRNAKTLKPKDKCMVPARTAMAIQADGWWLRQEIVWHKPNGGNRDSTMDRPRTNWEPLYLLSKSRTYWYNQTERTKRAVWEIAPSSGGTGHFAMMPEEMVDRCLEAGCPDGGTVLDPFFGAGTTGLVADRLKRSCVGIELNPEYAEIARKRIRDDNPLYASVEVL